MCVLTRKEIAELIQNGNITDYVDAEMQLQEHGFDVTVRKVYMLKGYGVVDFDNSMRRLPEYIELEWDENGMLILEKGVYVIEINEVVRLPRDVMAVVLPRSTIIRSGCWLASAVWDAGYEGRGKLLLYVAKELAITKNARIGQMVFLKLCSEVKGYRGTYQGEGIRNWY